MVSAQNSQQIFDVGDTTLIGKRSAIVLVQPVARPDWWGDNLCAFDLACYALPATGGTVLIGNRRYRPSGYEPGAYTT